MESVLKPNTTEWQRSMKVGNLDLQADKNSGKNFVEVCKEGINPEKVSEVLRLSCQNLCNLTNLFRSRSYFLAELIEKLALEKYSTACIPIIQNSEKESMAITKLTHEIQDFLDKDKTRSDEAKMDLLKQWTNLKSSLSQLIGLGLDEAWSEMKTQLDQLPSSKDDVLQLRFFRKILTEVKQRYSNFSTSFTKAQRYLAQVSSSSDNSPTLAANSGSSKSLQLTDQDDEKTNLWYNEFYIYVLIRQFTLFLQHDVSLKLKAAELKVVNGESSRRELSMEILNLFQKICGEGYTGKTFEVQSAYNSVHRLTSPHIPKYCDKFNKLNSGVFDIMKKFAGDPEGWVFGNYFNKFIEDYEVKLKRNNDLAKYITRCKSGHSGNTKLLILIIDVIRRVTSRTLET